MAGFVGADVAELRAFAKLVDNAGRELDHTASLLTSNLSSTRWLGPDGADFTARWNSSYRPGLTQASVSLRALVTVLIANADEQDATSSDTGGSSVFAGAHASGASGADSNPVGGLGDKTATQLDAMSPEELRELAKKYSEDPAAAHDWWTSLTDQQRATLIEHAPELVGGLDGVPALDRVEANSNIASDQIAKNDDRIADLKESIERVESNPFADISAIARAEAARDELAALKKENGYLQKAADGDVQLYTYDRDADRIVEMIGDPETAKRQLTYIPGTASDLASFYGTEKGGYGNGIQDLPRAIASRVPDTLVFITKDGHFPQWDLTSPPSDTSLALSLGRTQAQFQAGLDASGLPDMPNTAVGHSAGLAILTGSEQAGARYDNVVSLSGIGMDGGWEPQSGTKYYDYTTEGDAIWAARGVHATLPTIGVSGAGVEFGTVDAGFPLTPSAENGFTVLDSGIGVTPSWWAPDMIQDSMDNHSLIASAQTSDQVKDGLTDVLSGKKPAGS